MGRIALVFAAVVGIIIAVVGFLPLRLVLPEGQAYIREAQGTIWKGRLLGVQVGPLALGDFDTRFTGRKLNFSDGARLSGSIDPFADGLALDDVDGEVASNFPLLGPVRLSGVAVRMSPQGCGEAKGRVSVGLARPIPGIPAGQMLSGSPQCDKGDLLLNLSSQAQLERLELRVKPDFSHSVALLIRPSEPLLVPLLQAAGFVETPTGYRLQIK